MPASINFLAFSVKSIPAFSLIGTFMAFVENMQSQGFDTTEVYYDILACIQYTYISESLRTLNLIRDIALADI